MKTIITLFLASMLPIACSLNGIDKSSIVITESTVVIDVRTEKEYKAEHLQKALHLPYDTIQETITTHVPDREAEILLYCRSGRRSEIAKNTLDAMGYKNVINAGAYKKLKELERDKQ